MKQAELFYENQLGEKVPIGRFKKQNPMIKAVGPGPKDERCKACKYLRVKHFSKTYFKCEWRGDSNGPGTDHRANWPACGKFIKQEQET